MNLSGNTKPFAVLGHPIRHTLSPVMHNAAFEAAGMDAIYMPFDVEPYKLMKVLPAMVDMGFGGVNLTMPLKQVAFKGLADFDESARSLGAVNTIEFVGGSMLGHNTDGEGFLLALEEAFGKTVEGKAIFVLGAGGVGRAVAITCAAHGAGFVSVADIIEERSLTVTGEISAIAPATGTAALGRDPATWARYARASGIVVQASPMGMKETDESPIPSRSFHDGQAAFDLVYTQRETAFMKTAASAGAKTSNGLGMLLHQGARAFQIWTGKKPDLEIMRLALREWVYGRDEDRGGAEADS